MLTEKTQGKCRIAAQYYFAFVVSGGWSTLRFPFLFCVAPESVWRPSLFLLPLLMGAKAKLRIRRASFQGFVSSTTAAVRFRQMLFVRFQGVMIDSGLGVGTYIPLNGRMRELGRFSRTFVQRALDRFFYAEKGNNETHVPPPSTWKKSRR